MAFDAERVEVRGTPVPVLQHVVTGITNGAANFDVGSNGTLTYVSGSGSSINSIPGRTLVWVDRAGRSTTLYDREGRYRTPRLSPDEKRVAVEMGSTAAAQNQDINVIYTDRGTPLRLTTAPGFDGIPLWTPNGTRITFSSNRAGAGNALYWMAADGTGTPELLTNGAASNQGATSWSPDGKTLAFYWNVDIFTVKPGEAAVQFSATPFTETGPTFSPDGHWLAYTSDETGQDEIYITPYPGPGGKIPTSTSGGRSPKWSANGRELFYRNGRKMMAATVTYQPTLRVGTPRLLFEGDYALEEPGLGANNYDVSGDGQRFVMMKEAAQPDPANVQLAQIIVVQNWVQELKRLVSTK